MALKRKKIMSRSFLNTEAEWKRIALNLTAIKAEKQLVKMKSRPAADKWHSTVASQVISHTHLENYKFVIKSYVIARAG